MRAANYRYQGCGIDIEPATLKVVNPADPEGDHIDEEGYVLVITDPHEPATHVLPFDKETKAKLMEQMSSGIVPASAADLQGLNREQRRAAERARG